MAQQLRAHPAPAEDERWLPTWLAHNCLELLFQGIQHRLWSLKAPALMRTYIPYTPPHLHSPDINYDNKFYF